MLKIKLGKYQGCCSPLDYVLIYQKTPALLQPYTHTHTHTWTCNRSPENRHHSQASDRSSMCWGMLIHVIMTRGAGENWFDLKHSCGTLVATTAGENVVNKLFVASKEKEMDTHRQRRIQREIDRIKPDRCLLSRFKHRGVGRCEASALYIVPIFSCFECLV